MLKRHWVWTYMPPAASPELTGGRTATGLWREEAYEEKYCFYIILAWIRPLWVQMQRRQVAYRYIDCSVRKSLGTAWLCGCISPLKTDAAPHLWALNAETVFLWFKAQECLTCKNIGDCMRSQTGSNGTTLDPPFLSLYNTFKGQKHLSSYMLTYWRPL